MIPWYVFGLGAAAWVTYDEYHVNTQVDPAVKWAWPIIVFFFSIIGLGFYLWTTRPPNIGKKSGEEAEKAFKEYVSPMPKKVAGSVIHCVGGDGLGIMTAMVVARLANFSFWGEFWFEYAVGFAFGWFIFQLKAMLSMTGSIPMALWMAGRAEFFSMLTVMAGMGAVMGFVSPLVVAEQPDPDTFAFWSFGMLGLLVGFILTYPMNWMLVKIEWKHGLG
ncbi:MAG: DUF4396 domain-containing protein [Candidatus Wenzhouxiangella sp. M2_3B_020]